MGRLDADGHHGKMRQEGAARAARERAAVGRRQSPVWGSRGNPRTHAVDDPRGRSVLVVHARLTGEESARTACESCTTRRRERGNGGVALHEGYEGLSRGAVVAPLCAALYSSFLSAQEQAYLRSVVVDVQWRQRR